MRQALLSSSHLQDTGITRNSVNDLIMRVFAITVGSELTLLCGRRPTRCLESIWPLTERWSSAAISRCKVNLIAAIELRCLFDNGRGYRPGLTDVTRLEENWHYWTSFWFFTNRSVFSSPMFSIWRYNVAQGWVLCLCTLETKCREQARKTCCSAPPGKSLTKYLPVITLPIFDFSKRSNALRIFPSDICFNILPPKTCKLVWFRVNLL